MVIGPSEIEGLAVASIPTETSAVMPVLGVTGEVRLEPSAATQDEDRQRERGGLPEDSGIVSIREGFLAVPKTCQHRRINRVAHA
jgi:hypothetical protein